MNNSAVSPVIYLPHGGGPLPLLGDHGHIELNKFLGGLAKNLKKPDAILIISAHWEENLATVTSNDVPGLMYDYYGFPEEAYQIEYPAKGNSLLAEKVHHLLNSFGVKAKLNNQRSFDHGMFVPLKLIYPEATIPCVQLSLLSSLDPMSHIEIGKALASLREDNVIIIGSGFSFHNMREFKDNTVDDKKNAAFEKWLIETCTDSNISISEKESRLINWVEAPFARYCQPREEHLLPLHVCFGAGYSNAELIFNGTVIGKKACAFRW